MASVGQVLTVESLIDVVFYRGLTMQVAVPCDTMGRSDYGMCALNPLRVGPYFGEMGLSLVVEAIAQESKGLLEIVNFNVENMQYVVAGCLINLDVLRLVLDQVKAMKLNFKELVKTKSEDEIKNQLLTIIGNSLAASRKRHEEGGNFLVQERGTSTIPLAGTDEPFHSSFLLNSVVPFREIIRKKLEPKLINVDLLVGKYIPNLVAEPLSLSPQFAEKIYHKTQSPPIKKLLDAWNKEQYSTPSGKLELGYTLLVELLAYQFASPVRWAETQDHLFSSFAVERLVEVGPKPIVCSMAIRTLKMKYEKQDDALTRKRFLLCISKDSKEIYHEFVDQVVAEEAPVAETLAAAPSANAVAAPASNVPAEKIE